MILENIIWKSKINNNRYKVMPNEPAEFRRKNSHWHTQEDTRVTFFFQRSVNGRSSAL